VVAVSRGLLSRGIFFWLRKEATNIENLPIKATPCADEDIPTTSAKKRLGFQEMVANALDGKIGSCQKEFAQLDMEASK
jgi:hypothetical protein